MARRWYLEWAVVLALLLVAGAEDEGAEEEASESPEEAKALGLTMIGCIFFVMGVYYLTHSWDPDIRLLTWATINDTISIFCAVMLYSSVTDLCELGTNEEHMADTSERLLFNKAYVVFWYCCLITTIAWCVGLGHRDGPKWRKLVAQKEPFIHEKAEAIDMDHPHASLINFTRKMAYGPLQAELMERDVIKKPKCAGEKAESSFSQYTQMKNNLRCCTLFAHTTGFAGIAGWKIMMASDWFKDSWWHCVILVPYALAEYYVIIKITQYGRRIAIQKFIDGKPLCGHSKETHSAQAPLLQEHHQMQPHDPKAEKGVSFSSSSSEEEEEDELLEVFEEEVVDGENDFFGLFMSTLIVSTIKFAVGGKLDLEEDESYKFTRGLGRAGIMYLFAVVFFVCAYALLEVRKSLEEGADKKDIQAGNLEPSEGEEGELFYENFSQAVWKCLPEGRCKDFIVAEGAKTIKRLSDLFVKILTMSFAWSFMYATQWFLGSFYTEGENAVLAISLAMCVSLFSVIQIYVLDFLADRKEKQLDTQREQEKEEAARRGIELKDLGRKREGKDDDEVLRTLLESIGILIGFVWEAAFDDSLEGIVGEDEANEWVKPVLGILTVLVIFPVWRMYIVPMQMEKGYILGFIPSKLAHRMERIFNDKSIGEDVQDSARVAFEEAMMVMLAFDKPKEGGNAFAPAPQNVSRHLDDYDKWIVKQLSERASTPQGSSNEVEEKKKAEAIQVLKFKIKQLSDRVKELEVVEHGESGAAASGAELLPGATQPAEPGAELLPGATQPAEPGAELLPGATQPADPGAELLPGATQPADPGAELLPGATQPADPGGAIV